MFNSKASYYISGASINFRLVGSPDEVERDVNVLYNHGVISNIPETFTPGRDESVTVQSDRTRISAGFLSFASAAMHGTLRHTALRAHGKSFVKLAVEADALATFQELPRERPFREKKGARVRKQIEIDDDETGSDAVSPELKEAGKRILAQWFGAKE